MRKEYVERGLERNYPLLEDPHDRRIFKTPAPLEGFLHIARKYMTPEELEEARRPKYYGDIRYKPGAAANPTAAPTPAPKPEARAVTPEPAPSTAAPAAADTSSDDEDELQVLASDDELTGIAARLAKSSILARAARAFSPPRANRDPNGVGRGSTRGRERR